MDRNRRNRETNNKLKIIPLGGIGEVGKNMTVIEWGNNILVIDCGLMFPNDDMLGIDYVIPDVTYLEENREKIKAFVITHGHEDHIGATPYDGSCRAQNEGAGQEHQNAQKNFGGRYGKLRCFFR